MSDAGARWVEIIRDVSTNEATGKSTEPESPRRQESLELQLARLLFPSDRLRFWRKVTPQELQGGNHGIKLNTDMCLQGEAIPQDSTQTWRVYSPQIARIRGYSLNEIAQRAQAMLAAEGIHDMRVYQKSTAKRATSLVFLIPQETFDLTENKEKLRKLEKKIAAQETEEKGWNL